MKNSKGNGDKSSLLERWRQKQKQKPAAGPTSSDDKRGPLSLGQQRLWFLQQLYPDNPFYHYADIMELRGKLQVKALRKSFIDLAEKYPILRTTFPEEQGQVFQYIHEDAQLEFVVQDLSSQPKEERRTLAEQAARESASQPFDLAQGPLTRIVVLRLDEGWYWLVLTMHHIITDKWSMGLLREDLARLYIANTDGSAANLRVLPHTYLDYTKWQRQQKVAPADLQYWTQKLGGELPILKLPVDHIPPPQASFRGAFHKQSFSPELSKQLQAIASQEGVTLFIFLLTAFKVLLSKYSGQKDIVIGTPFSNRDQLSLQELIGFFNDTLVLRSDLENDPSFRTLLGQVQQTVLEAFSHKNVPFELLVRELSPERASTSNPLFQVMFLFHKVPTTPSMGADLELVHQPFDLGVAKFDLTLYISEEESGLSAIFEYATDLFEEETIVRMQEHFRTLLEGIVKAPNTKIGALPILTEREEYQLLEEWNQTEQEVQLEGTILDLFQQQVSLQAEQLATVFGEAELSYKDLQTKAQSIASWLVEEGLQAGEVVGLHTARSLDMIIGIMGILQAGGAYLPIDPEYPADRVSFMIADTGVRWVLSQAAISGQLPVLTAEIALLSSIYKTGTSVQKTAAVQIDPGQLAYIIYTSGSTGKPKGVQVTHRNLLHSTRARFSYYLNAPTRFLLLSSFAFDSSVVGIFWTLCTGGTLVLPKHRIEQDLDQLAALIESRAVSHTLLLPSLYNVLLQHIELSSLKSLNTVIVAGEACSSTLVEQHFAALPNTHLYNEYGPTEASVWCTAHKVDPSDVDRGVPIGRPIPNAEIYILDENKKPVPTGVAGELYVGGAGITAGYLNRPDLNTQHFIPNPFRPNITEKLYRTGDLAKYRSNGLIDFLGRADRQVKIRGYRIELTEIQAAILQGDTVQDALVIVQREEGAAAKLMAYFIGGDSAVSSADILGQLRTQLPAYMVPSHLIQLEGWPRLPNGKINEKALPRPAQVHRESTARSRPAQNEVQQQLVEIWEEVLGTSPIGIHDNFFEIGGDSILSIQIIAKARKAGLSLAANQLFEHQTIASLALFVDSQLEQRPRQTGPLQGTLPLLPIQHWFFDEHKIAPHHWNQGLLFDLDPALSATDLATVIEFLVKHHDGLRLNFNQVNQKWKAEYREAYPPGTFEQVDASGWLDQAAGVHQYLENRQQQLALSSGPLFIAILVENASEQNKQLALIAHHLIIDAVSWKIIVDDLATLLAQQGSQKALDLGNKSLSLRDWAEYLEAGVKAGSWDSDFTFWSEKLGKVSNTSLPFDQTSNWPSSESRSATIPFSLSEKETQLLLQDVHQSYHTKIDEILLVALWKAVQDQMKVDRLTFGLERHGRETLEDDFDFVGSVGWFTSFFPLPVRAQEENTLGAVIKYIKEELRRVPNGGLGYGVLRYLTPVDSPLRLPDQKPDIVFNYLGHQDLPSNSWLQNGRALMEGMRHGSSERYYALEVNASVKEGQLVFYWTYSQDFFRKSTVEDLIQAFQQAITAIIGHCTQGDIDEYTPSDFPDAEISQDDLDNLLGQITFGS
ncbi:MAG: amino acid adenylation domain-containing protein [Saprospiraceae bacterium]|nr:amino acid adenylation domain-containing protein [Saprospiraceae bacterium]